MNVRSVSKPVSAGGSVQQERECAQHLGHWRCDRQGAPDTCRAHGRQRAGHAPLWVRPLNHQEPSIIPCVPRPLMRFRRNIRQVQYSPSLCPLCRYLADNSSFVINDKPLVIKRIVTLHSNQDEQILSFIMPKLSMSWWSCQGWEGGQAGLHSSSQCGVLQPPAGLCGQEGGRSCGGVPGCGRLHLHLHVGRLAHLCPHPTCYLAIAIGDNVRAV